MSLFHYCCRFCTLSTSRPMVSLTLFLHIFLFLDTSKRTILVKGVFTWYFLMYFFGYYFKIIFFLSTFKVVFRNIRTWTYCVFEERPYASTRVTSIIFPTAARTGQSNSCSTHTYYWCVECKTDLFRTPRSHVVTE